MTLDERLTDALEAAARTVPDNAVPREVPEFDGARRWRKPALVAALAAAAVAAAVVVPLAVTDRAVQPTTAPCPAPPAVEAIELGQQSYPGSQTALDRLPFGAPPKVPFLLTKDGRGYLEDRGVRVPLPSGDRYSVLGRTSCGWLVVRTKDEKKFDAGLLGSAGDFRPIGPIVDREITLSPDGTRLAYHDRSGPIVVLEVASGKELASYPAGVAARLDGWNTDGIWFAPNQRKLGVQLWRPGSAPVVVVPDSWRVDVTRTNGLVMVDASEGIIPCFQIAVLEDTMRLRNLQKKVCGTPFSSLSPDGELAVTTAGTTGGFFVRSREDTPLEFPGMVGSLPPGIVWEDARHIVGTTSPSLQRQATVRCDVLTGACERIQDGPPKSGLTLGKP
ncbi:hypothetical protein GCM10009789_60570 [Kribbella sancticallisti]|uniref:Uncharacterized protein n=1 Tax=Kribbella sancticallisti TaxID=460087 RepID=A0ABP4Q8F6_9ACTN